MSKKGKVRWIKSIFVAILAIVIFFFSIQTCKAEGDGDLDDHISKYKDDPIAKLDELGDDFVNINFIIAEALGRIDESEKDRNINSVVVGPGSNVGDIYNIHLHEPGESITPDNSRKK
jgi:hypothetical protein